MKLLLIPAKSKTKIKLPSKVIKKLQNKKIGLAYSIQYIDSLKKIKKSLPNSIMAGQIIGCNVSNCVKIKNKVDSYLFIGSGEFHPIEIALKTSKLTFKFNPETNQFSEISKEEIKKIKIKIKGKYIKYLTAKKLGIIVSTKPGQYNLKKALQLQKQIKKESFIFLTNNINEQEFENFREIDFWINTACSRIETKKLLHYSEIEKFNKNKNL